MTNDTKMTIKEEMIDSILRYIGMNKDREVNIESLRTVVYITENIDVLDNNLNQKIASLLMRSALPGSNPESITGKSLEISVARPLSEDLHKTKIDTKLGSIKFPPAEALGIPQGANIVVKV